MTSPFLQLCRLCDSRASGTRGCLRPRPFSNWVDSVTRAPGLVVGLDDFDLAIYPICVPWTRARGWVRLLQLPRRVPQLHFLDRDVWLGSTTSITSTSTPTAFPELGRVAGFEDFNFNLYSSCPLFQRLSCALPTPRTREPCRLTSNAVDDIDTISR